MTIYAIRANGLVLDGRYRTWDEAVEAAQEEEKLPAEGDWLIVVQGKDGNWYPSPPFGIEFYQR